MLLNRYILVDGGNLPIASVSVATACDIDKKKILAARCESGSIWADVRVWIRSANGPRLRQISWRLVNAQISARNRHGCLFKTETYRWSQRRFQNLSGPSTRFCMAFLRYSARLKMTLSGRAPFLFSRRS